MKYSDSITNIAVALVKAQSEIEDAVKDTANNHLKTKYADLNSVRAVIRKPLADNGLCVIQGPRRAEGGVEVETMILHTSGEWISEDVFIPVNKWDAHGMGSGITYGRRYGLMSLLCIGTEDDDGQASGIKKEGERPVKPPISEGVFADGMKAANVSSKALSAWWSALSEDEREQVTTEQRKKLKAQAALADNPATAAK